MAGRYIDNTKVTKNRLKRKSSGSSSSGGSSAISYLRISALHRLTVSHRTHDIDWHIVNTNYFDPYTEGTIPILDYSDATKLLTNNAFGNKERVTNDLGGSVWDGSDGSTADYAIDHLTGLGWYLQDAVGPSTNWVTSASVINSGSFLGYTDWRMPTKLDCELITQADNSGVNVIDSIASFTRILWHCMDSFSGTHAYYYHTSISYISMFSAYSVTTGSASIVGVACRNHY